MRFYFIHGSNLFFLIFVPLLYFLYKKYAKVPTIMVPDVQMIKKIGKTKVKNAVPMSIFPRCLALFFIVFMMSEPIIETDASVIRFAPTLLICSFLSFVWDILWMCVLSNRIP